MSISLPTYTRREMPLLSRRHRVRAIIVTGLKREFRRPSAIFAIGIGSAVTSIISIVFLLFVGAPLPGQSLDLSFFFFPASNPAILFFVTLMASVIGSGLIADDVHSMAFSLYLSRPITAADYLIAKASILAPLVAMIAILPLVITPLLAALLGFFPWVTALQAMGLSILVGSVMTAFYTAITLFLSSLTRRKSYAAAGVFAITFGLAIPAELLASPQALGNSAVLYLSPYQDYLAVARAAFGAAGNPIDAAAGLAILLGGTLLASFLTYVRMAKIEVVSG